MKPNLEINTENTKAQMRKGILEYCILLVISRGKVYSSDILRALKEANLIVVEGTIYPLLTRLKNSALLSYDWEESQSGPPRKYYSLTDTGRKTLEQLTATWRSLRGSIESLTDKFMDQKDNESARDLSKITFLRK
ncbi:MAG: PadR family transcriptional regulator [Candidatus Falkowbacteria bacterium]